MNKLFAVLAAITLSFSAVSRAENNQCAADIESLRPYQSQVADEVTIRKTGEEDYVRPDGKSVPGYAYVILYKYPGGRWLREEITLPQSDPFPLKEGSDQMFFLWGEANYLVREAHPEGDHHVPILVERDTCVPRQLDWSRPAKAIPN